MEKFFRGSKGPQSVNSQFIKRELSLGGPDLIRWGLKGAIRSERESLTGPEEALMPRHSQARTAENSWFCPGPEDLGPRK